MKYAQFRQDIRSLGDSLRQLESIINNANSQGLHPHHFGVTLRTLPDVTGDFRQTLNDCERLLRNHAGLQSGRSNVSENFGWWTSAERDVCSLRERVKFHVTKVAFIVKPFETQLLLGIRRDVQQLRRDVAYLTRIVTNGVGEAENASNPPFLDSVVLPDYILTRFTIAFNVDRPVCFEDNGDWPLKEGFDALVFHFSKSTIEFNSRPGLGQNIPEAPQYLSLLKCIWIMKQLKSSSYFTNAGTDSLWADYMRGLEDAIRTQFRRFEAQQLIAPTQDVISILPDSDYSIWVVEGPLRPLDMAEQRSLEENILELSLPQSHGTRQSSLTVFRQSDTEFRLVTTTKRTDNQMFHHAEGFHVDMTSTRLIPSYATPNERSSVTNNIVFCNNKGQSAHWISLSDSAGIASLQRALMGYRVHHDMSKFRWCVNGSKEEGNWGEDGRLQLWQFKPLPGNLPDRETQSTRGGNASVSTSGQPQSDFGSNRLSPELPPPTTLAKRTTPIAANNTSISNGVAEPSSSTSYQLPWNADSITSAPPLFSYSSQSIRDLSSPSSRFSWRPPHPTSKEKIWSSVQKPDLKRHSTGRSSTTMGTRSSIAYPVNGPHGDGVELCRPEVPVLVIFTMCRARYTFLHVKREQNLCS